MMMMKSTFIFPCVISHNFQRLPHSFVAYLLDGTFIRNRFIKYQIHQTSYLWTACIQSQRNIPWNSNTSIIHNMVPKNAAHNILLLYTQILIASHSHISHTPIINNMPKCNVSDEINWIQICIEPLSSYIINFDLLMENMKSQMNAGTAPLHLL